MQIRTLFIVALALTMPALAQDKARFFLTAKDKTSRLSEQPPLLFRALEQP